jgi:hypothetical protein
MFEDTGDQNMDKMICALKSLSEARERIMNLNAIGEGDIE